MIAEERIETHPRNSIIVLRDGFIAIEAWLFTKQRIRLWAWGVIFAYAIGLVARLSSHSWLFHSDGRPSCIDFSHFWVSGKLAESANPAAVYIDSAFSATRAALTGVNACTSGIHFVYPPIYLFFTYPFGSMPFVAAFAAWTLATLLLYLSPFIWSCHAQLPL
jgi:hypothetical protein